MWDNETFYVVYVVRSDFRLIKIPKVSVRGQGSINEIKGLKGSIQNNSK